MSVPPEAEANSRPNSVSGRLLIVIMFVIVVVIAGSLIRQLYRSSSRITSLAVLPISDSAGSPTGEAISQDIADRFWRIPAFRMITPGAIRNFQQARQERVKGVLVGYLTGEKAEVILNVELWDAQSNAKLWTRTYRRARPEVSLLSADLFTDLIDRLQLELTSSVKQRLGKPPSLNGDAYLAWARSRAEKDGGLLASALRLDPGFTLARADLAQFEADRGEWRQAKTDAEEALRQNNDASRARGVLGRVAALRWDWGLSRGEFQAGLDASPGDPLLHHQYAEFYLLPTMQIIEARSEFERALASSPNDATEHAGLARAFYAAHDFTNARQAASEALRLDPNSLAAHYVLAGCAHQAGDAQEEAKQDAAILSAPESPFRRLLEIRKLAESNDKQGLIASLQKALDDHWAYLPVAVTGPEIDPFQKDPKLVAIRQATGFR